MNITQIKYFVKAAQIQNLTRAAKMLYISPQALSKQIMALEDELGTTLFERSRARYELTPVGRQIYHEAENMVSDYDNSVDIIKGIVKRDSGIVTIVCPEGAMKAMNPNPVEMFEKEYGASVEIMELPDIICEEYIAAHHINIGFSTEPLDVSRYKSTLILTSKLCAVVRNNHPLAKKDVILLTELTDYPVQAKNKLFKSHGNFKEVAERKGLRLEYVKNSADYAGFRNTISTLDAVGIGLWHLPVDEGFVKIPLDEEIPWNLYFVEDTTTDLPLLIGRLAEMVKGG